MKNQIVSGLKSIPANLARYPFLRKHSEETEKLRKRYLCGVCHPDENYALLKEANIRWVRFDIPYPFTESADLSQSYRNFRERAKAYTFNGIRVMAVTPYPGDYLEHGADIRTPAGEQKVRAVADFLMRDLRPYVSGLQITNEMGIPRFTHPFSMDDAAKFIGIQLEEMAPNKGSVLLGYNSAGPQADLHTRMKPYLGYCDYVGIDIYMGCFAPGFLWMFDALLDYLWALTGKPVLLQEFGYISGGSRKTASEKRELLMRYGAANEKEAAKDIAGFTERLPEKLRDYTKRLCEENPARYFDFLFHSDVRDHLYCELPRLTKIPGYAHTPEGQAEFYRSILERLYRKPFVCGSIIYCFRDSAHCYVCGQSDCPVETRWGLVDMDGNPKPSFFEVKKAFGAIQKQAASQIQNESKQAHKEKTAALYR